jgi:hypothetical protein
VTKNIMKFDVVHHMNIMMKSMFKITLPEVGSACFFGTSALLNDGTTLYKAFLPKKQDEPIKSNLFNMKVP